MTGDPRIFISYSRQDGAVAAAAIREGLAAGGLSLWQDLVAMEGGRDWWRQIEEAIGKAEYLVLLLTPKALESEVCAKEWRYARQQGTYVVPVSDGSPGKLELHRLAGWMRRVDIVDFRVPERWTWLVGRLKQPPQVRRVPMMAEAPPSDFVPRPAEFLKLKAALLDPATKEAVGITAALKGAGGYGKTTLARALCADEEIQDAYHDGVLWVTLGERPGDLLGRVADLIEIVAGGRPGFANVEAACVRLEELLAERRMLVVIDDAWSAADTRPFLRGGPHCARLITTRDNATLPRGAAWQPVDEMRGPEAVALLRADLPPGEDEALRRLAARLGEWPLLLRLANGALVDRVKSLREELPEALAYVGKLLDKRGLSQFRANDAKDRRGAVDKTLALSLDRLDPEEQARLMELAVFPEDIQVPLGTVALLWRQTANFDEIDTDELLQRLIGLSLLLQLDLDRRFLQLHDVIRTWLRERLGDHLREVEEALVGAFRSSCGGEWHRLDDPYALAHLPIHLRHVDEGAWHRLLLDPRWMARRLAADGPGVAALIDDYRDTDADLRLVGDALRLSAHVIGRDPMQLPGQLCGRLGGSEAPGHLELLLAARGGALSGTLLLRHPTLMAPGGPLIRTLEGHIGAVTAITVLPDGRRAISCSSDHTLKLWDLETGAVLRTFEDHADGIYYLKLLPDGRRILSGSLDRTLKLWDLESGAVLHTFRGHEGSLSAVKLLPDGRRALSGSSGHSLKLWDLDSGAVLRTLEGHSNEIKDVALLPDGRRALSGSWDHTIKLWDLDSGAVLRTFKNDSAVTCLAAMANGHLILSGSISYDSVNYPLQIRNLESGEVLRILEGCTHRANKLTLLPGGHRVLVHYWDTLGVVDLESGQLLWTLDGGATAMASDGRHALSGSRDGTLKLWDLENGAVLRTLEGHADIVWAVKILPDGRRALSGSSDHTLKLWDLTSNVLMRARSHSGAIATLAVLPDGPLSGSRDGTLKLWDFESGAVRCTLEGHTSAIMDVALLPDGRRALSASRDHTLKLWDLGSGTVVRTLEGHTGIVGAVALLRDGRRAISRSSDQTLKIWDLESGAVLRTRTCVSEVTALALLPDDRAALYGVMAGPIIVWDLETGAVLLTLKGHRRPVAALTPLLNGSHALSRSWDGELELWDLRTGDAVRNLGGIRDVTCVALLPDGRRVLSGSLDSTIKLWDLESGAVMRTFRGHGDGITALSLLPDGHQALSGSTDSTLRLWDLERGICCSTWRADQTITCVAAVSDRFFIAGDAGGAVHFLDLI